MTWLGFVDADVAPGPSSLYRTTELYLYKVWKSGNIILYDFHRGRPIISKKKSLFFPDKVHVGSGGVGVGVGLELVSEVVFGVFFEISLLVVPEPHTGHTNFPDFYIFS